MKKTAITLVSNHYNNDLEKIIETKDIELKELARKNAKHYAKSNQPDPAESGMAPYTGDVKAGYEELISYVYQYLQPGAHLPEAQMDGALVKEQGEKIDIEIKKLESQNKNDEYELGNYKPANLKSRIRNALIITAIISVGEIIFNTKAFQVIGDNLLFSLILSISLTVAVFAFSHIVALMYKNTEDRRKKIMLMAGSLAAATAVFIVLAFLRSEYVAKNDMSINPVFFIVINLFFFIVTALFSYYLLPSWKEISKNREMEKKHEVIETRKKEIERLKQEKENIREAFVERNKQRVKLAYYTEYTVERIKKKYQEAVQIFMSANLTFRTDRKVPVSFSEEIPPIEINNPVVLYQSIEKE